jgi:hypothetical protein
MSEAKTPSYRVYSLDSMSKILRGEWLTALHDQAAIATAKLENLGSKWELWDGNRLVATDERPWAGPAASVC